MKYTLIGSRVMDDDFVVYESPKSMSRDLEDAGRFQLSLDKLKDAGISVRCVLCTDGSELCGEAEELYSEHGDDCLPLATYSCVIICQGRYPTDQELVDYLDVPTGTLSAERAVLAQANDLPPSCNCRRKS